MAVLQDEFEFVVRDGLKLKDAINIDDGRSMNADEAYGIETIGKFIKGGAVKQASVLLPIRPQEPLHDRQSALACG